MDSDVSAEGDFENESPRHRSWVSSNSEGHQSSPNSPAKNSEIASSSSDGESSPNASPNPKRVSSSDRESSIEAKDSDASDKDSSSDVKDAAGSDRDSSPDRKNVVNSDRDSSPDHKNVTNSDRESSPETKENDSDHESSPEPKNDDRESSPDLKNDSDRERSPSIKNPASPPTGVTSPENGVWPSSPSDKPSPVGSTPASPTLDDYDGKNEKNHIESDGIMYENVNGDVSPKSPKRSNSVEWDSRSDIASSLDSVSPSQFERQESSKGEFNDKSPVHEKEKSSENKKAIIDFADDLSDVSDIESNDSFDRDDIKPDKKEERLIEDERAVEVNDKQMEDAVSLHVEGEEQLDFEAEEGECSPKIDKNKEREEIKKEKELSDLEEGELSDDNDTKPEETERPVCRFFSRGHCTWGSNCRFIHPGVMDKGNYSMFETVRPIITPGGPPPPNSAAPMMYPVFPQHIPHSHLSSERPGAIPPGGASAARKDEPPAESAWERGLRQAKEMIRKSSKRKETEVDFEDKKMNLTLSQDEIDKENDYYSRHSGSPAKSTDGNEKWKLDGDVKSHRGEPYPNEHPPPVPHAGADVPPIGYYPPIHHGISRPDYWGPHRMGGLPYEEYGLRAPPMPYGPDYYSAAAGRRYMHPNSYYPPRPGNVAAPPSHHAEFYDRKPKHKQYPSSSREVIVQKNDKPYKDDSPTRYRNRREDSPRIERARDDEWADPWMRTKSPASGRRRRRKDTYSSGSSYSSSSESSRSSSRSSFSSKSRHSRSRSKSGSPSHSSASESQTRKKPPMQFKLSPSSRSQLPATKKTPKPISPSLLLERRAATERALHMNPPPPSPKIKTRPHSPPVANTTGSLAAPSTSPPKAKGGLPDRLLAHSKAALTAAMRSTRSTESRSSKSSSGSSSSDSSSDSSDSSASSSTTSKSKSPPVRTQKRNVADDHSNVSQAVKTKAMDALKLSGQKQQIKLTLKGSGNSQSKRSAATENSDARKDRTVSAGKKRVAESSESGSDSDRASPTKKGGKQNSKKGAPSRREELLKQLKAVEDAIARKRSKIL